MGRGPAPSKYVRVGTLLGARIKQTRLDRSLSGAEMARSIGMDVGQYHRLEHADNADPPFATVVRIARKLDVSLDWLALTVGIDGKTLVKPPSKAASKRALEEATQRIQEILEVGIAKPEAVDEPKARRPAGRKRKST